MPSKKKTKKGPRKAAKAAKKKGDDDNKVEATIVVAVDSQMQRLKIQNENEQADEDAFLEEAIQLAAAEKKGLKMMEKCRHAYPARSSREHTFCEVFLTTFIELALQSDDTSGVDAAMTATEAKFPGVWKNAEKLELIKSLCFSLGAATILVEEIEGAQCFAFAANYMEQWVDVTLHRTKAVLDPAKCVELLEADENTLVSYFRTHIPCSCLDEKYEEHA